MAITTKTVKLTRCKCERCAYEWTPRHAVPDICPQCKSHKWDSPRTVKK